MCSKSLYLFIAVGLFLTVNVSTCSSRKWLVALLGRQTAAWDPPAVYIGKAGRSQRVAHRERSLDLSACRALSSGDGYGRASTTNDMVNFYWTLLFV